MALKTIFLDVGGVLIQTVETSRRRLWETRLGLSRGQLTDEVYSIEPGDLATIGQTTDEIIWKDIQKHFALSDNDTSEMKEDFYSGDKLNVEFYIFAQSLKNKYSIALFTNAWENARHVYVNRYHLDAVSAKMIVSAEEGLEKPDPRFFELALGRMNTTADETLFIDDTRENIKAAKKLGIHTVLFRSNEQAISDIKELLKT